MHPCRPDLSCRSGRVVWGALRRKPRATEPNPELGVVEPETARDPGTIEPGTWVRGDAVEPKWRELDARKGKEAKGEAGENTTATRKRGKRNRASQPDRECIGEGRENQRWGKPEADPRGTKVEENRTQGRGKETGEKRGGNESAETRGGPALIPTNEPARAGEGSGNAETGSDLGGSGNDRRAPWSARVIYPGRNRPSGRGRTGPCGVSRGGCSPMCRTPCCSHLVPKYGCGPFHQIINHCGTIRSADLSFEPSKRKPNHIISQSEIVVPN